MALQRTAGFTLIELIITIVLLGIISAVLAPVIQNSVEIYTSQSSRAVLIQKGRLVLERIAREVREAVPNSLSVITDVNGDRTGIEFVQIKGGGRYIDISDIDPGVFINVARKFTRNLPKSELYSLGTGQTVANGDLLIIANTSSADLINAISVITLTSAPQTDAILDGTVDGQVLTFTAPHTFPSGSPGKRYFIADATHEVGLVGTALHWHRAGGLTGYDTNDDYSAADPMLVDGVTGLDFNYDVNAAMGNAVLSMTLSLTDGTESIDLYQETQIRNSM